MSPIRRRLHSRLRALVAVLAPIGMLGAGATTAQAGEYTIGYCPATTAPLQNWVANADSVNDLTSTRLVEQCTQGQPITIDGSQNNMPRGGSVEWQFRAPPETVIVDWDAATDIAAASRFYYVFLVLNNGGKWGVACGPGGTFSACGTRTMTTQRDRPAPTSTVARFALQCLPQGNASTCDGPVTARLARNNITLRDDVGPGGEVTGGTLLSSGPGAPIGGTASADFVATDSGSGVRRVEARIDGTAVGATASQCDPPFTNATPCPARVPGTVSADLTKIAPGTHSLQIVGIDASGAENTLKESPIVVRNGEPIGPGADPNLRGAQNGSYAADDGRLVAFWPATGRSPSKSKAVQRACKRSPAYRRKHKIGCAGRAPLRNLAATYDSKRNNLIRGRLTTSSGQPIAGATVTLTATAAGRTRELARPTTDAAGMFETRMPVRAGSARIAVTWLSRAGDSIPAVATTLNRKVKAASTFRAERLGRAGRRLALNGRLLGQSGSQASVPIVIQISAGEGWKSAITVQAKGDGRWRARYLVPRQLRGTYRVRALVKPTNRYPYAAAATASKPVTIR